MNTMNMPGFTAEASLYNGNARYQATAEASFYGGIVQPAQLFSDSTTVSGGFSSFDLFRLRWGNCLKSVCVRREEVYPGLPVCVEFQWVVANC